MMRIALLAAIIGAAWFIQPADAEKRRPNGCDWIGGDFAEPGEVIFNTGCRKGPATPHKPAPPKDEPPKLLDRVDARAPANYGASTRKSIGAGLQRFEVVDGKIAYGLNETGDLWRFALGGTDSMMVARSVREFRALEAKELFLLEKDGTLWRADGNGTNRTFIDHEVADFQPFGDIVYIMGTDKRLWRLHADGKSRDLVDAAVSAFQAVDSNVVFVLGTDAALWRETGDFHTRTKVGQPIASFEHLAVGDTTYVTTPSHILWRQTGSATPTQVDHDVTAFRSVDQNLVYVLATDGRLWQEFGDRSHAVLVDGDLAVKSGVDAFQFASPGNIDGQAVFLLDRKHGLWAETMPTAR